MGGGLGRVESEGGGGESCNSLQVNEILGRWQSGEGGWSGAIDPVSHVT